MCSSFQNMMSVPQISTTVMKTLCALTLSGGTTASASLATLGMEPYAKVGSVCGHCSALHIEPPSPFSRPSASFVCTSWTLSCLSTTECCYMAPATFLGHSRSYGVKKFGSVFALICDSYSNLHSCLSLQTAPTATSWVFCLFVHLFVVLLF